MEEIIRYLMENFIKNLENLQLELYREPSNLADFVLKTRKETDEMNDLSKEIKEKEQARYDRLCEEFAMD